MAGFKLEKTKMMTRYLVKLAIRITVFACVLGCYLWNKQLMWELANYPIYMGVRPFHLLWVIFMGIMIRHIFPTERLSMALRKAEKQHYHMVADYSRFDLLEFVQSQNVKAWVVMLVWLGLNAVFGVLYLFQVLDEADLLMLTVFFFLCDYICILFFCPFQTYIMKNRCCVNCRIYGWGHFMMFTPMLFIRNFFSWSLFFTSLVVLIHWEIIYAKYPERFWYGSNKTIQCANCKDKTCQMKKQIAEKVGLPTV